MWVCSLLQVWGGKKHIRYFEKDVSPSQKNEYMNVHARWVYRGSVHTSELEAVTMIFPPRFSCTVLLSVPGLNEGSDYVQRLDGEAEGDINLKENRSFPHIQASGMWIKTSLQRHFSLNQHFFTFVPRLYVKCKVGEVHSSVCLCEKAKSFLSGKSTADFRRGAQFICWKKNMCSAVLVLLQSLHFTDNRNDMSQICCCRGEGSAASSAEVSLRLLGCDHIHVHETVTQHRCRRLALQSNHRVSISCHSIRH